MSDLWDEISFFHPLLRYAFAAVLMLMLLLLLEMSVRWLKWWPMGWVIISKAQVHEGRKKIRKISSSLIIMRSIGGVIELVRVRFVHCKLYFIFFLVQINIFYFIYFFFRGTWVFRTSHTKCRELKNKFRI